MIATPAAGMMGHEIAGRDWSGMPLGPLADWPAALLATLGLILPARTPIALFWGPEQRVFYNDAFAEGLGERHPGVLGRPAWKGSGEALSDLEPLLACVRDTGESLFLRGHAFPFGRSDQQGEAARFDIALSAVRADDGGIGGVLCLLSGATRRADSDGTAALARMFEQAPSFMAVLAEPGHVYELANDAHRRLVGGREILGHAVREVLPELEEQGIFELLDQVVQTGEPFAAHARSVMLSTAPGAPPEERLLDFVYQPIKDAQGNVVRIFVEGNDVTERVRAVNARRVSDERLRLATEAGAIGIWDFDITTGTLRWDARCRALFGLPPEASVTYEGFLAHVHPDDRERVQAAVNRALDPKGDGGFRMEYRIVSEHEGEERWISAAGGVLFAHDKAVRFIGVVQDISARKQAERALAASEAALREETRALEILNLTATRLAAELDHDRLVQAVVDAGVALIDARIGAFFYNVSDAAGDHYMPQAVAGAWKEDFADFPLPRATALFGPTFHGEGPVRLGDIRHDPRHGLNTPIAGMPPGHSPVVSYLAVPVTSRSGEVLGGLFFGHDAPDMFSERDERLIVGLAAQAAVAIDNARLFHATQHANEELETQIAARTAERDRIWRFSQELLAVADTNGVMQSVNPAWTRLLGWKAEEITGRTVDWMVHPDDRTRTGEATARLAASGATQEFENRLRAHDGGYRVLSWRAVRAGAFLYCVGRDVTDERAQAEALAQTEEQLRQAQKMETLGQLTGGIAHDFNNLLQIIIGNVELLRRGLPEDSTRLRRAADNAMTGANRAAMLTQRLLAYARRQPLDPRPTDANRLVEGMSDLLHRTLGETIRIETVLAPRLWLTEVDPNQLEMTILNLAVNARDAMPDGGQLTIETSNIHLDRDYVAHHAEVSPGQYVAITMSDTGAGMSAEVLSRVFEPFFTTKDVGKGTGLGLSMVYGFVKQSGGHVKIHSEPGKGTVARIYLPRHHAQPKREEPAALAAPPEGRPHETILVCEDDEDVRAYTTELLRELGYTVIEAPDGPAAAALLEQADTRVDLLFTDVVLPDGMSGAALAERARVLRPGLKILFTTGYARDVIIHHGRLDPGVELITKPFSHADLAARVRDMLDS